MQSQSNQSLFRLGKIKAESTCCFLTISLRNCAAIIIKNISKIRCHEQKITSILIKAEAFASDDFQEKAETMEDFFL